MIVEDLGRMGYRQAWQRQEQAHEEVAAGGERRLLLVEHSPVITFGRRPGGEQHLRSSEASLTEMGVELVQSDRGGDITFHGPGQIVAYPIVRLADHGLSISGYVRRLETVAIGTLAAFNLVGERDAAAPGVWVSDGIGLAKICAVGVRIRRGVTLHGIALNVQTDLKYFNLIVPCGLADRRVTSMKQLLGDLAPSMPLVQAVMIEQFRAAFEG
jgi:lipoyl(octanoyl) transferase